MLKKGLFYRFSLVCLLVLLLPSYGWSKSARITVLPWKVNSVENMDFVKHAMVDMLSSRIGSNAGMEMIRAEGAADVSDGAALETGKRLKADYVLYGSLTVFGNSVSIDAKLLNVNDGSIAPFFSNAVGMDSVIGMADKIAGDVVAAALGTNSPASPQAAAPKQAAALAQTSVPAAPVAPVEPKDDFIIKPEEPAKKAVSWKSRTMDGLFIAMTASDLNKDGVKEVFLLEKNKILVGKVSSSGLEVVKELKAQGGVDYIALASIDGDNDGAPELYISGILDNKPYGSVLEYRDNGYKVTVTGVKWFMRTIQAGKAAPVLIGQLFRKGDGFYGDARVLKKEGAKVVDKGAFEITLPKKVDIYRFEAVDIEKDGTLEIISLDDREYLQAYKKGDGKWEKSWKSADFYGGTLNFIYPADDRPGVAEPEPVPVEGRFFHSEKENGTNEVIIKKNTPGGLGRYGQKASTFSTGEVISITLDSADGELFTENWRTKQVRGYISDFFIDDIDKDGANEIVMLVVEGTEKLFGTPKSYVLSYRVSL